MRSENVFAMEGGWTVPTITVYKCDMCGRMWKPGKNDKAISLRFVLSPHDTKKFKEGQERKAIFCSTRCGEMAVAMVMLNFKPKLRTENDKPPHGGYRISINPFGSLLGFPPHDEPLEEEDDDDED